MSVSVDQMTHEETLAALAWQVDLGADEAILEAPLDRYAEAAKVPRPVAAPGAAPVAAPAGQSDPVPQNLAAAVGDLVQLRAAVADFDGCGLKRGARNLVFADGNPKARVMIIGEAPGREEDAQGRPFVGRSGQLLNLMFQAIGLSRGAGDPAQALYITNMLPWRPPQNRDPSGDELAMMMPFLKRHIALAAPEVLVTMGNASTKSLLETSVGITRLRGQWQTFQGLPLLPMFHPAALLRDPLKKRQAWADLLALKARL